MYCYGVFTAFLCVCLFLSVAPPSRFGWVLRTVIKGVMMGMLGYACYRAGGTIGRALLSIPSVQSLLETLKPPQWSSLSHQWHNCSSNKTMHLSPMALKHRRWGWRSPHYELTWTSRGDEPPPRIDVPVDAAGPYCQRNRDSTFL